MYSVHYAGLGLFVWLDFAENSMNIVVDMSQTDLPLAPFCIMNLCTLLADGKLLHNCDGYSLN